MYLCKWTREKRKLKIVKGNGEWKSKDLKQDINIHSIIRHLISKLRYVMVKYVHEAPAVIPCKGIGASEVRLNKVHELSVRFKRSHD